MDGSRGSVALTGLADQDRAQDAAEPEEWAIRPAAVLLPDGEIVEDVDVVVRGSLIVEVTSSNDHAVRPDWVVSAPDSTLLPGLVDSHVHLTFNSGVDVVDRILRESASTHLARAAGNAQRALARGVTTAMDCGGVGDVVITLRDSIAAGSLCGPRLLVAGPPLTTTAGHCHWLGGTADSSDDLIRAMRQQVAAGVDFIKVMVTGGNITQGSNPARIQFPAEAIMALGRECERLGKVLVTHAHTVEAIELSAAAGARIVAHATCVQEDGGIALGPDTVDLLTRSGCYVDPTLMVGRDGVAERRAGQRTAMIPLLRTMHDAGIPLTAGTDAGVPGVAHGSVSDAIVTLHEELGLDVSAALLAGTAVPARAYGIDDQVGAIAPGLVADLLLVDGRVDEDIRAVTRPVAVWRNGSLVMRDGLVNYR